MRQSVSGPTHLSPQWLRISAVDHSQLGPSLGIALSHRKLPRPSLCSPPRRQPSAIPGWYRGTKAWPPHLNLGQFWRAISAPMPPYLLRPQLQLLYASASPSCIPHSLAGASLESLPINLHAATELILVCIWSCKGTRRAKTILKRRIKLEELYFLI